MDAKCMSVCRNSKQQRKQKSEGDREEREEKAGSESKGEKVPKE